MEEVEFLVYGEFKPQLAHKFGTFTAGLTQPCIVKLSIRSVGGDLEVLRDLESSISQMKNEGFVFKTDVQEFAYSCGLFLFLLGDIKTASDTARFMYHAPGIEIRDERLTSSDAREILEILEAEDIFVNRVLAENTTLDAGMYEILKKNDNFLSRQDLIFLGFMEDEYELI